MTNLTETRIDVERARVPRERLFWKILVGVEAVVGMGAVGMTAVMPELFVFWTVFGIYVLTHMAVMRVSWSYLSLNSVRVTDSQFPHIFRQAHTACESLGIPVPEIRIFSGGGIFGVVALKQARRRGELILTAEVASALAHANDSRHLLMIIGREMGALAAGHHDLWFITDYLGELVFGVHQAWRRRCDLTADRIGLMVCGDPAIAEQAVLMMYVGPRMAFGVDAGAAIDEGSDVRERVSARLANFLTSKASLEARLRNLRDYSAAIRRNPELARSMLHPRVEPVEMLPLMIVHGHDLDARDALVECIKEVRPFVRSIVMQVESRAAETLPEKFERLATGARGAIAVLTPDDLISAPAKGSFARARQNVVLEVGWFWGRVGRGSVLLLLRGDVEVPSDLSGIEYHSFRESPRECETAITTFIDWVVSGNGPRSSLPKELDDAALRVGAM